MSRIRPDYEMTKWRRFQRFVNGEELPEDERKRQEFIYAAREKSEQREEEKTAFFRLRRAQSASFRKYWKEQEKRELQQVLEQRENWADTKGVKLFQRFYRTVSLIICISVIAV
ncbi:MAG: hypothetical protein K2N94_14485, partial [Lachnospiraceae bacterium]|nr:hypothetical protein [Lachnospiraceae bacterium]